MSPWYLSGLLQRLGGHTNCEICHARWPGTLPVCGGCHAQLPWISHGCESCGEPVSEQQRYCARCLQHPLPFAEVIIPLRYAYPIDHWVGVYKYQARPGMARWLAQLLQTSIEHRMRQRPALITGVPMHPRKQRERGYNQSLLLARHLAKSLQLPFAPHLVEKRKLTSHQRTLNAASRRLNLQGAFHIRKQNEWGAGRWSGLGSPRPAIIEGQAIAVVDDVVTTGATGAELAHCLLQAGAASVSLWALAKTPLHVPVGSGSHMPLVRR